jgi:hypothetical protein
MGVAVNPLLMEIKNYRKIVGVAWSAKNLDGFVNVAVGLNTNDLTNKVVEQAQEIADLKTQFQMVVGVLKGHDKKLATALEIIDVNPVPPVPDDDFEATITYYMPQDEHIDAGIQMAIDNLENELKSKEIDTGLKNALQELSHFKNDPEKNKNFKKDFKDAFDKEVEKKKEINDKKIINGKKIKTVIADLE